MSVISVFLLGRVEKGKKKEKEVIWTEEKRVGNEEMNKKFVVKFIDVTKIKN